MSKVWNGAQLYQDRGAGYELLDTTAGAATLGVAATVLAASAETVNVTLAPGQTLPTFTVEQVAAGKGLIYLGGEILQYRTATLVSGTTYTLSNLTNRGARFTAEAIGTHANGEPFAVLDDAVRFVPFDRELTGQTLNFKVVTFGAAQQDALPSTFTLLAPNYPVGRWEPLSNGDLSDPQIVYFNADPIVVWVER